MEEIYGELIDMGFPQRLAKIRKEKGLTQQALADLSEVNMIQISRYETSKAQPSLDAIKSIAVALGVTTDALIFESDERGPDEDLRLEFEAVSRFNPEEKKMVKSVLKGLILKHEADRWRDVG